ncbi:uncharacterized protein LOC133339259 [Lethenteron reissneri]|uniref:uncharacterized protein LOC133339259 n=1 Tax=Lethenteron reissneri TaxID=7753 RepID=UPI002AB6F86A|nr:uncharacterized protein LOC133339259 [Lethenteron reissneri]
MASCSCLLMMMLLLLLVSLAADAAGAAGDSGLTVTTERRVFATPGGRAVLACSFSSSGWEPGARPLVEWSRLRNSTEEKILVAQKDSPTRTLAPRVEWSGDLGGCNATIAIVDVDRSDVGSYVCHVTDPLRYREGRSSVELVMVPAGVETQTTPTLPSNGNLRVRTSGAVSVRAGVAAILECSYSCGATHVQDTAVVVEWWRMHVPTSEKILVMDGSTHLYNLRAEWIGDTGTCNASIVLRDVRENDTGSYLCDVLLLPAYNEGRGLLKLEVAGSSETPSGREEEDRSRVNAVVIAVVIGIVAALAGVIIAAVVYFVCKRMRESQETQPQSSAGDDRSGETRIPLQTPPDATAAAAADDDDDDDDGGDADDQ